MPILRAAARSAISSIRISFDWKNEIAADQSDPSVRLDWERAVNPRDDARQHAPERRPRAVRGDGTFLSAD